MRGGLDHAAETWIRAHVDPTGPVDTTHERPWSTVARVPTVDGPVWFKACGAVQAFEPRLTAALSSRWPGRVADVIAHDEERQWLLLADAGSPVSASDDRVEVWPQLLPRYAELQRGEAEHASAQLAQGVPDLRVETLPGRYEQLLACTDLPLEPGELRRLEGFASGFAELCGELAAHAVPATIQHDDLHYANVHARDGRLRVMDWGDSSVGHPFASLVVTFRFLEEADGLPPGDPVYGRLREAYLEPWGTGLVGAFELAVRVGAFAHAFAWLRQREYLAGEARNRFDRVFVVILRRAIDRTERRRAAGA